MNPAVAVLLAVSGVALLFQISSSSEQNWWAKRAGVVIATVAGLRLFSFGIGQDMSVDQLLFSHRLDLVPNLTPNRMAPNTAVALVLLGLAMAMSDITSRRGRRPAEWLSIGAAAIALLALIGYLYNVTSLYHVKTFIPMAFHTAVAIDLLAMGLLAARPTVGMMSVVTSSTVGGQTARKLLPAAVIVPIGIGWLRVIAQRAGAHDVEFGITLVIVGNIVFFFLLTWSTAGLLQRADARRRSIEGRLSRERNILRTLLDNVPDSIFIKNASGHYITCNMAHARFAGVLGPEEIAGKTVFDLHPPDVAKLYQESDQMVMMQGESLIQEQFLVDSLGKSQWAMVNKIPLLDEAGNCSGLVGITRDITRRKVAEQNREQAEALLREQNIKLQELAESEQKAHADLKLAQGQMLQGEKLAALGQLVAGVAHEINNPLSFVSNNIAVLQRDVKAVGSLLKMYQEGDAVIQTALPELSALIRELSEQIDLGYTMTNLDEMMVRSRDGLKRIQQIVKDLRDFARLDESDLHEVDLNQGVESTVNIIRGRAKSRQVAIDLKLKPLPPVACFPAKINQVIMNLVANAIDACGLRGTVTIESAPTMAGVSIDVIDNGSGIPAEILERIFDPFFTTKPQGEGTGLGLSISYGIIRDHGGTITVESKPGAGSRFSIRLPLRAAVPKKK